MALKKFAQVAHGRVVNIVVINADSFGDYVDITDRPEAVPNAEYDAETDTFTAPNPDMRRLLKALVLIIKANADKITIPAEALEIWQEIKDNRL